MSFSKPSNVMTTLRTVQKGCAQHPPDLRLSWPNGVADAPSEGTGMAEQDRECEVVVVGAGYSGLAAARHLARAGVEVLVLEARHRVGGRSFTEVTEAGSTIDRGGQWIGPTQDHLAALAAELGVATFPTYTEGQGVELRDGGRDLYVGLIPTSDPEGAADGIACMLDLDLAAFEVPLHAPWDAADAAALDAQTLATYFDTHLTSASARAILEVAVKAIFGTGSGELSLLFTLFYLHAGGGLTNLARTTGGAQERRFAGGSQQLAEGMAAELGERVILGRPVETVAYGPRPRDRRGRASCRRAPTRPTPARHPRRAPGHAPGAPSSPWRRRCAASSATRRRCPDAGISSASACRWAPSPRCTCVYDEPFWRADGLNGQIVAPGSVMESAFDNSPEDASHGAIVGFVAGDDCRRMEAAGPAARQAAVLDDLVRAFGPKARSPGRDRGAALARPSPSPAAARWP